MEKLKAKHDHKLTDVLKVFIFGLFLIMPFLVFAPALLYISFNQNAQAEETTINVDEYKQVDFNQILPSTIVSQTYENNGFISTYSSENNSYTITGTYSQNTELQIIGANSTSLDILQYQHKYLVKITGYGNNIAFNTDYQEGGMNYGSYEFTATFAGGSYFNLRAYISGQTSCSGYINLIDLTQMFGAGNEPTVNQMLEWYPKDHYEYTLSKPEVIKVGTSTETIQDVETQIANNWQQMWNKQIFKWTNETILYKGINAFSQTFGIFDNSYITNLITYELIIVMIYIVIDIILTMFKWLTHMIGEK